MASLTQSSPAPLASLTSSSPAPLTSTGSRHSIGTTTVALESVNEETGDPGNQRVSDEKRGDVPGNQRVSDEKRGDVPGNQHVSDEKRGDVPGNDDNVFNADGVNKSSQTRQYDSAGKMTSTVFGETGSANSTGSSPSLDPALQRRFSLDEPRSKYIWSPRMSDQVR